MAYGPTSELGVVFLFGRLAPQLGFCVESVRPQFCDCIATRRGKRLRVEFEYWASAYASHKHAAKGADVVICWENDWEGRPKEYRHLEVISLQEAVGAMPRVFAVGCDEGRKEQLRHKRIEWNVPAGAQIGDLVLMYRNRPTSAICDAWKITGPYTHYKKSNPGGRYPGLQVWMTRIAQFQKVLSFEELAENPKTKDSSVVRKRFQGKTEITDYWPRFFALLTKKNPSTRRALEAFLVR